MNKRGMLLLKQIIEIMIAVIVISLILYASLAFFRTYFGNQDEMQAKGQIGRIMQKLDSIEAGEKTNLLLQAPADWYIVAFDSAHNKNEEFEKPSSMFGKNCICICKKKCKSEICRIIKMPLKQESKVHEQALIKIEIKEIWFMNMENYYKVAKEKLIAKAELTDQEKEEVAFGIIEIKKIYDADLKKTSSTYYAEVNEHFVNTADFENFIKALIWKESSGKVDAISFCGAVGLMQLMPDTAREQGLNVFEYKEICNKGKSNPCSGNYKNCYYAFECNSFTEENCKKDEDERYDAQKNIKGGTNYLVKLIKQFNDKQLALAAYNAGPGNVRKICKDTIHSCPVTFKGREYAESVMAYYLES